MKKFAIFASLVALILIAPQAKAQRACLNVQLQGSYSFVASGTLGAQAFASAGQGNYAGDGNVSGVIQINLGAGGGNSALVSAVLPWSGTYTINPDCTATKTISIPNFPTGKPGSGMTLQVNFFITAGNNWKELRFISTDTGAVITGTARSLQP